MTFPYLTILGMAVVTFATRYIGVAAAGQELPPLLRRWLHYVPISVLAALIAPEALAPDGPIVFGAHTLALVVGLLAAWRTRNVFLTLIAGLAAYWLLRLMGAS